MQMSLRQKISNKIKAKMEQASTMESFDETSLKIQLKAGKSQLHKIHLACDWQNPSVNVRSPQLNCQWYNKTESDIQPIEGVQGDTYQTSLADVGTIIHIQCFPILQGIEYEGMPIIKDIGPILLDHETEEEAKDLLDAQKATFFIEITQGTFGKLTEQKPSDGLVKVNGSELSLFLKNQHNQMEEAITIPICESYPHIKIDRSDPKQLTIVFNQNNESAHFTFADHQIRDVFLLLMKLIVGSSLVSVESPASEQMVSTKSESPTRQSASTSDLMSLAELKRKLNNAQEEKALMQKALFSQKQDREEMQRRLGQSEERLVNLNRNYFDIENQLATLKSSESSDKVQLSYHKNQNKNLKGQTEFLRSNVKKLEATLRETQEQLGLYTQQQSEYTYTQLLSLIKEKQQEIERLTMTNQFSKEQKQATEGKCRELQQGYEDAISEKNYIQRKYESLYYEKTSLNSSPMMRSQISEKSMDNKSEQDREVVDAAREREILILKKQVKETVEENDFLRMMNSNKDKKNSSKTQLKMQLLEIKKIVNRLTETIGEKDIAIDDIKSVNRDLNYKLVQLNKMNMEVVLGSNKSADSGEKS